MKVIVNKFIPFHGFIAMMFYNVILWRKEYEKYMENKNYYNNVVNHESIHLEQMKDFCPWVPVGGTIFYIVYFFEWIAKLFVYGGESYSHISFEVEAKTNENDLEYIKTRKHFAQWRKNKKQ